MNPYIQIENVLRVMHTDNDVDITRKDNGVKVTVKKDNDKGVEK